MDTGMFSWHVTWLAPNQQVLKIAILAERDCQDYSFYVDVILNVIRVAGDYVSPEVRTRPPPSTEPFIPRANSKHLCLSASARPVHFHKHGCEGNGAFVTALGQRRAWTHEPGS
jgi:hypothetical protein